MARAMLLISHSHGCGDRPRRGLYDVHLAFHRDVRRYPPHLDMGSPYPSEPTDLRFVRRPGIYIGVTVNAITAHFQCFAPLMALNERRDHKKCD